jgi:hypothetical protein
VQVKRVESFRVGALVEYERAAGDLADKTSPRMIVVAGLVNRGDPARHCPAAPCNSGILPAQRNGKSATGFCCFPVKRADNRIDARREC